MTAGQQVSIVVINNGVIVQHAPTGIALFTKEGQPQPQQNIANHIASFDALISYLKSLELFQDEA